MVKWVKNCKDEIILEIKSVWPTEANGEVLSMKTDCKCIKTLLWVTSIYNCRGPLCSAASRHQLLLKGYNIHIWNC